MTALARILLAWWFIAWTPAESSLATIPEIAELLRVLRPWQIVGPFRELDQCLVVQRFVLDHGLTTSVCGLDNLDRYFPWTEPFAP